MATKVKIIANGAVKDYLEKRIGPPPYFGLLHPHKNAITGLDDPYVTYTPAKGGAGYSAFQPSTNTAAASRRCLNE